MRTHSACQVFGLAWLPCCMQVRWDNQSQYPEVTIQVTIESFVGQSSIGLLCPSAAASTTAQNTCLAKTLSLESGCTHTHTNHKRGNCPSCASPDVQSTAVKENLKAGESIVWSSSSKRGKASRREKKTIARLTDDQKEGRGGSEREEKTIARQTD